VGETPDGKPRRVAGLPRDAGHRLPRVHETEPRVLGLPRSWYGTATRDFRGLRHPIRWVKWKAVRHRLGPYAPGFTTASQDDPKR
jgi:hypothetical protein